MIFDIHLGNISTWRNTMRLVLNKNIRTKEEYDAIMKTFSNYLFTEGFMMSRAETGIEGYTNDRSSAGGNINNLLSDTPVFWKLELYDKRNRLITRDTFVA